jgi:sugar lactone lactonase YvrE
MRRIALLLLLLAAATPTALAGASFPDVIPLPNGFNPEGIATGNGETFYVGSIPTGAVVQGSLRTGEVTPLVPAAAGRAATGLKYSHGRLWVSGAGTGKGFVYDAQTGGDVAVLDLAQPPASMTTPSFVNDVVVTPNGAFFTDSMRPVLYRVATVRGGDPGAITRLPLSGDYQHVAGFNLNGIDAAKGGLVLIAVQSATGKLFAINPNTGVADEIDLGGATLPFGDGILLQGQTLFVVQNQLDRIAVVRLGPGLRTGTITGFLTDDDLDVPTTIAPFGNDLYAVNARFGRATPADNHFEVVKVRR